MLRSVRTLSLCAALLLGASPTSQAGCLDWLFGCRSCNSCNSCDPCGGATTTYRPLFPRLGFGRAAYYGGGDCCNSCYSPCAPTCAPCVQYVPQTSYRACCVSVPVTTCRAVTTCDPCTGCPVTVMRPVTTCVQQVRYTPVVTYRPVCPTTCASPCSPCGTSCGSSCGDSCGNGSSVGYAPSSSCCSPAATPVVPGVVAPSTVPVVPGAINVPQTFQNGASYYRPTPAAPYDYNRNYNTNYRGQPVAPPVQTRAPLTTELPQRSWTFRPVSSASEQPVAPTRLESKSESHDASGWRAAKK